MSTEKKITNYINSQPTWKQELVLLRELMNHSGAAETIKWGIPVYTVNGKNIAGIAAFKNYVGLWFYQGVFLTDKHNKLINAQEGITKALRQWRFESIDEIDPKLVSAYMKEAIANAKAGKELKPVKKTTKIPEELQNALSNDKVLQEKFNALTPYKQREFAEHIASAKQEKTRLNRLEKSIPLILQGIGLHDKYKNC